jgi:hypothetical protein
MACFFRPALLDKPLASAISFCYPDYATQRYEPVKFP